MDPRVAHGIIRLAWVVGILYWLVTGFGNKRTRVRGRFGSILVYILLAGITLAVLAASHRGLMKLLFPENIATQLAGILICIGGIAFAIWARRILGRNWSGFVTVKQDHEIIQAGPYAYVRHPIYTGIIAAIAGTKLALDPTLEGLLLVIVWSGAFYLKAGYEERLLIRELGQPYMEYRRRVRWRFIPGIL
ncbi:MAG TPA: isoprenylcysteine carboxylmethyltransferase family protein [Chthoniobacteraceae bacterium]|jgi:protein-S-isoprenylcysteine O-methyltransferase Ste14|nr:isoprenylcysteine carboxylmethyltransferase family protein [Chthoniobacteraceae bacterium]